METKLDMKDDSLQRTAEAVDDLNNLLQLSHHAAVRLKKDIPSDNFPLAFKLAKSIEVLQEAVEQLRKNVDTSILNTSFTYKAAPRDSASSSDRL